MIRERLTNYSGQTFSPESSVQLSGSEMRLLQKQYLLPSFEVGTEVLNNSVGVHEFLTDMVEDIAKLPAGKNNPHPENQVIVWSLMAKSMMGKDALIDHARQVLNAAFEDQPELSHIAELNGGDIPIYTINFSTCALAAQIDGRIPMSQDAKTGKQTVAHRKYTESEYRDISRVIKEVMQYGIYGKDGIRLLIYQPSAPSSRITQRKKIQLTNDRGDSVVHWLATNKRLKDKLRVTAITSEGRNTSPALAFRQTLSHATVQNIERLLTAFKVNIHFKKADGTFSIPEKLTLEQKRQIVKVLPRLIAPASSVRRSDTDQFDAIKKLYEYKAIPEMSERAYYSHFKDKWNLPDDHFIVTSNPDLSGPINYYFETGMSLDKSDLVFELYPELATFLEKMHQKKK